jgi:hypothetical protein
MNNSMLSLKKKQQPILGVGGICWTLGILVGGICWELEVRRYMVNMQNIKTTL